MVMLECHEASAASAVGTNIASGMRGETDIMPRIIRWVAVVGSAAAGDAAVDLYKGREWIGRYRLTATGTSFDRSRDQQDVNALIMPLTPIRIEIADAGLTNVINVFLDVVP